MSDDELQALLAGCRASHARVAGVAGGLAPGAEKEPCRLPGWTVGHLLSHLARNADSHVWMLEGAMAGEVRRQYPGGGEQRTADIEAGAARPLPVLVDDLEHTNRLLEAVWSGMDADAWAGSGINAAGVTMSCPAELPRLLSQLPLRLDGPGRRAFPPGSSNAKNFRPISGSAPGSPRGPLARNEHAQLILEGAL